MNKYNVSINFQVYAKNEKEAWDVVELTILDDEIEKEQISITKGEK